MRYFARVLPLMLLPSLSSFMAAQNTNQYLGAGLYQYSTQDDYGFDQINVGNNNLHFSIPIVMKSGRGLPFQYSITYDSEIWSVGVVGDQTIWNPDPNFGFRGVSTANLSGDLSFDQVTVTCSNGSQGTIISNVVYTDAYGVPHPISYGKNCNTHSGTGMATDGSGYKNVSIVNGPLLRGTYGVVTNASNTTYEVSVVANGEVIASPVQIADANGNQISATSSGVFTDTTGTQVLIVGGAGTPASPRTFQYPTPTGSATATIQYAAYTIQTAFNCSSVSDYGPVSTNLPTSMTLGDGVSTYSFTYEPTPGNPSNITGRLHSVTLPTGGIITYTYSGTLSGDPDGCQGSKDFLGYDTTLTRTVQVGSSIGTVSYARTPTVPGNTGTTIKTDALNNQSKYWFVDLKKDAPIETHRQVWQGAIGSSPNANTLLERYTCYNNATIPCDGNNQAVFDTPTSITTATAYNNGPQVIIKTQLYNNLPNSIATGDYGSGSTPLSTTAYSYYNSGSQVQQVTQSDAAGTLYASTTYGYDETSVIPSGAPQLMAASGPRGNQTSAHYQIDSNSANMLTTTISYYDTGLPAFSAGPIGPTNNTTQYGYDSSSKTFLTSTVVPTPASGISLVTSALYDTGSGVLSSSFDYNNKETRISSYDALLRPKEIDYPDSGKTIFTYVSPNQVSTYRYTDNTNYEDSEIYYDNYGRLSHVGIRSVGLTWYWIDECYNANGLLSTQTYPHIGTATPPSDCSAAGDQYTYDALGRLLLTSHADNTAASTQYSQRAVLTTSESGRKVITQYDGLGRITFVCEITGTTLVNSGAPVSCGSDIPGSWNGYLTNYTYSLANHQTTITQGSQTRVFTTDWLGRTTSIQEPEMRAEGQAGGSQGITTFSYAYNATGLVVTRQRPRANQASATVLTTTTMQYDTLGRPVSITYTDGTPTKTFIYDATPSGWSATTNVKGRLAGTTRPAAVGSAAEAYSYDEMGRVNLLQECLPSGCGTSAYVQSIPYHYDYAGNLQYAGDGHGGTLTYGVTQAGEITSISLQGGMTSYLSGVINTPNGPSSFGLGNGLNGAYGYDSLGRVNGFSVCSSHGTATPGCGNSAYQYYGYTVNWTGVQATSSTDTVMGGPATYGYGDMDQLTAVTGTPTQYNFTYDRWGNRATQTCSGSGTCRQPSYTYDTVTNHNITVGIYDAAGNLSSDGVHSYSYDADGNVTSVDGGATATYSYDAMNQRVRVDFPSSGAGQEYVFDKDGKRLDVFDTSHNLLSSTIYWGSQPLAIAQGSNLYFEHQDWVGIERMRTDQNANVEGTYVSAPYGDGYQASGGDTDAYHFAGMDTDSGTGYSPDAQTSHGQFRQYSSSQGGWMSMDPYFGSYDPTNPQSFNRYSYAAASPLSFLDPLGLCPGFAVATPVEGGDGIYYMSVYKLEYCSYGGVGGGPAGALRQMIGLQTGEFAAPSGIYVASNNATPWYKSCTAQALGSGAASIALDSVAFIPGGKEIEIGAETAARQIGNLKGYRGIVADNYGRAFLTSSGSRLKGAAAGVSLGDSVTSGDGISTTLNVLGLIPGISDISATLSIAYDAGKTAVAVYKCSHP